MRFQSNTFTSPSGTKSPPKLIDDAMSKQPKCAGSLSESTDGSHCSSKPKAMRSIRKLCLTKLSSVEDFEFTTRKPGHMRWFIGNAGDGGGAGLLILGMVDGM